MADNVRGGSTNAALPLVATDDVAGVHYQRFKLDLGADGASAPAVGAVPAAIQALTAWQTGQVSVDATAVQVASTALTGRKTIAVRALATNTVAVYIGATNSVTTATGFELSAGESVSLEIDAGAAVWAIAGLIGQAVCFLEVA